MSKLLDLYDRAAAWLTDENTGDLDKAEEFFENLIETVLNLKETPEDVSEFFFEWRARHLACKNMMDKHPEDWQLAHSEEMANHVEGHRRDIKAYSELYQWTLEKAPKSVPPTIIYYALAMYACVIHGFYLCIAQKLYGAELPECDHNHDKDSEDTEPA